MKWWGNINTKERKRQAVFMKNANVRQKERQGEIINVHVCCTVIATPYHR